MSKINNNEDGITIRMRGFVPLIGGIFFLYIGYINPIMSAKNHTPTVNTWLFVILATPLFLAIGLLTTILGDRYIPIFGSHKEATFLGKLLYGTMVVLGIVCFLTLKISLSSYGYEM